MTESRVIVKGRRSVKQMEDIEKSDPRDLNLNMAVKKRKE